MTTSVHVAPVDAVAREDPVHPIALATHLPFPRRLRRIVWGSALALVAVFVTRAAQRFLVVDEASYGPLWPNRDLLLPHFVGGSLALLAGVLQFWAGLRRARPGWHRWIGRAYLVGVAVAAASAFALSFRAVLGWPFGVASFVMAGALVGATAMAWVAVRRRQFQVHREWMLRSYVVAFGFVTFRLLAVSPLLAGLGPAPQRLAVLMWLSWTVPLLVTEWLLQASRMAPGASAIDAR